MIGSFSSENIQIAYGVSDPMPLQQFYTYMDYYGNFKVLDPMFESFVKHFILRNSNYIGKDYEKSVKKEIKVWFDSARDNNFFKMIAFTTESGEFDNVIESIALDKGIIKASEHIKISRRAGTHKYRKSHKSKRNTM